jgi:signal peptidase I
MYNTLYDNQRVLVLKTSKKPNRGDVIIFHPPSGLANDIFVKRVIGLPGDVVRIENGTVYVNNIMLTESYTIPNHNINMSEVVVGDNEYFVLGDNRLVSYDSHNFGCIPQANIIGKALFVIWPTSGWGNKITYKFDF